MPRVHQWIPCFTPGDAMGQAAVAWRRALRHLGVGGELYADEVAQGYEALVSPMAAFRPGPDDVVLYHHGIASPLAGLLLHVPCRRGVVYHNITPAQAYRGTQLEEALVAGRAQLAALADGVDVSIGVSRYNAAELLEAGHRNVHVVPLYVEQRRFLSQAADRPLAERLAGLGSPRIVSVSRVVPHKRVEDLITLHALVRQRAPEAQLIVVGGYAAGHAAFRALKANAEQVGNVTFLGRVTHGQLVAAYRAGDVYVSMSEHEGFGVPLIEAMAAELPVLAFGAAAVPETMGGAGLVFDEKHFAALAELVLLLTRIRRSGPASSTDSASGCARSVSTRRSAHWARPLGPGGQSPSRGTSPLRRDRRRQRPAPRPSTRRTLRGVSQHHRGPHHRPPQRVSVPSEIEPR